MKIVIISKTKKLRVRTSMKFKTILVKDEIKQGKNGGKKSRGIETKRERRGRGRERRGRGRE